MADLVLIGTSHIARESVRKVKRIIEEQRPKVVAVELDAKRYYALEQKPRHKFSAYSIGRVGLKGFLFALVGSWMSRKLGRMVGVEPGDEMRTAIRTAKRTGAKIALIDQDIEITLARFSAHFTWRERWQVVKDIFRGLIFREREIERYGIKDLDFSKVPSEELIEKLIFIVKENYPSIYMVLVEERNRHMATKLRQLMRSYPGEKIVAVVGAGHISGIRALLQPPDYSFGYDYCGQDYSTVAL